ncbi:MAG: twin-arginine translocase TatA/TatE family subunit [Candidatus Competibacterales bacterium]|nr:twin-arginine translocase TatA/TatE family subunit [Candidatus Competibacterales bacterium]
MGISIWQLLIILAIVLVLFGAKRLRNLGTDLGASVKGFRNAMKEDEGKGDDTPESSDTAERSIGSQPGDKERRDVIDGEVVKDRDKV